MSRELISRSRDLKRLRDEGYEIEIRGGYLLVKNVPYLDKSKKIRLGDLVSELTLAGNQTAKPKTHVVFFTGSQPCNKDGSEITGIKHGNLKGKKLAEGVVVQHSFSNKPPAGYGDFYEMMDRYATIISAPAQSIDPDVSPKTFAVVEGEKDSPFVYLDTASSRANIVPITAKLAEHKIAIAGLGGSGSYILDLVAKTPVAEIHLFDGDLFLQHNAFRTPGAASLDELRAKPSKVAYLADVYGRMHRGIVPHPQYVSEDELEVFEAVDFVFLSLDRGDVKKAIVGALETAGTSFIDVGMGLHTIDEEASLGGVVRVTTSTPEVREHVHQRGRIPFSDADGDDPYTNNIQIADLNALNAALAVIKWKKLLGFYKDLEREHYSTYSIDCNLLTSDDSP